MSDMDKALEALESMPEYHEYWTDKNSPCGTNEDLILRNWFSTYEKTIRQSLAQAGGQDVECKTYGININVPMETTDDSSLVPGFWNSLTAPTNQMGVATLGGNIEERWQNFAWLLAENVLSQGNYNWTPSQWYEEMSAALSPNAVVIPREEFERVKAAVETLKWLALTANEEDRNRTVIRQNCTDIAVETLAILEQYGEQ